MQFILVSRKIIILSIFILTNLSCTFQGEDEVSYDVMKVEIAGEGGTETILLESGDWIIASVFNKTEEHKIKGNIYDVDNALVKENTPLELSGFGTIESQGIIVGFNITYQDAGVLSIRLRENAADEVYGFVLMLQNGDLLKKIHIQQVPSAGYTFQEIEFFINQEAVDSIFMKSKVTTYKFDFLTPTNIEVSPFNGSDVMINSYFVSNDADAFLWLSKDSVEVKVPEGIQAGDLFFSDKASIYGVPFNQPYISDEVAIIEAPAGESLFYSNLEMRRRTLGFKLKMKSKGTSEIKEIVGQWIETSPTGAYEIIYDN